jgi:hypothetical protein
VVGKNPFFENVSEPWHKLDVPLEVRMEKLIILKQSLHAGCMTNRKGL